MGKNVRRDASRLRRKAQRRSRAYTAHYDHLGVTPSAPGDNHLLNGAVDNATGCGILLATRSRWSMAKPAPARSIAFAAVTGEEQGLLAPNISASILPVPAGKITLDLN